MLPGLSFIAQTYVERFKTSLQKIALLYQIDEDSTVPIGTVAMQKAMNFCGQVCWPSFTVAHEKTTSGEFSTLVEMIADVLKSRGGTMPVRDLARRFPNNRQVMKVIEYLIGADVARRKKLSIGGQPVDVLELT